MTKTRKFAWRGAAIAGALLFLAIGHAEAASADQAAEMLGITRNTASHSASGEKWVCKTRETLHKLTGQIGVPEMIKIGASAYYHIMRLEERGESFNISPKLISEELSKVAEYGGAQPKFDGKGDRYAKMTLIKAASYLPAAVVRRMPVLDARTVIGRGLFRLYATDRAFIKTNGVQLSLHELGHALEYSNGHLLHLRKEFYENRTRGKALQKLNAWNFPFGYRPDEKYRAGFVDRYMGKESGAEVYSRGLEYVFFNSRDIWRRDPEVTKFILGSLIFFGNQVSDCQSPRNAP